MSMTAFITTIWKGIVEKSNGRGEAMGRMVAVFRKISIREKDLENDIDEKRLLQNIAPFP